MARAQDAFACWRIRDHLHPRYHSACPRSCGSATAGGTQATRPRTSVSLSNAPSTGTASLHSDCVRTRTNDLALTAIDGAATGGQAVAGAAAVAWKSSRAPRGDTFCARAAALRWRAVDRSATGLGWWLQVLLWAAVVIPWRRVTSAKCSGVNWRSRESLRPARILRLS